MFLLLNLAGARLATAQSLSDDESAATRKVKIKVSEIGKGKKIVVTRRDETKLKGVVSAIDPDSFALTDKKTGAETRFGYAEVKKVSRAGMSTGAKLAIGASIAVPVIIVLALLGKRICNESAC
ncbi:MAG TPA: hypothetical protein VIL74_25660 [Pyrinomonadaceae bacterium]